MARRLSAMDGWQPIKAPGALVFFVGFTDDVLFKSRINQLISYKRLLYASTVSAKLISSLGLSDSPAARRYF
jgi:hypothetical protein